MKNIKLEISPSKDMIAEVLTKGLVSTKFEKLRELLGVKKPNLI